MNKMVWWKKLIYPFVWLAVTVIVALLQFLVWAFRGGKIPLRWEIVGIQKKRMFIKEV